MKKFTPVSATVICLILIALFCPLAGCSSKPATKGAPDATTAAKIEAEKAAVKAATKDLVENQVPAKAKLAYDLLTDAKGKTIVAKLKASAEKLRKIEEDYAAEKAGKGEQEKLTKLIIDYVDVARTAAAEQEELSKHAGKEVAALNDIFAILANAGLYAENEKSILGSTKSVTDIMTPLEPALLAADSVVGITLSELDTKLRSNEDLTGATLETAMFKAGSAVLEAQAQQIQAQKKAQKK